MIEQPSEYQEQVVVAKWLDDAVGENGWFHPPNEGIRDPRIGAKLKKAGLKPGLPDIIVITRPPIHPSASGAVIELKRRDQTVAAVKLNQRVWLDNLSWHGWLTAVCFGAKDAIGQLKDWGYRS